MSKHLNMWFEGWRRSDAETLGAIADDSVCDHPIDGRFAKPESAAYVAVLVPAEGEGRK